jgi:3-phenylpropionate/cinnamic acid dioxygenase small subunit
MSRLKLFSAIAAVAALATVGVVHGQTKSKLTGDDFLEIQALYYNYAHYIDSGQGEKFASLWTEDGEFTHGYGPGQASSDRAPAKGTAALTRTGSTGGTRHMVTNLVIRPTDDANTVKGSCYLLLYSARTVPPSFTETAIYDDTIVHTANGWKFKKRIVWRDDDDITPFKPKPQPARGQGRGAAAAPAQQ